MILVVMGVSGCGKSTLASALAERLAWPWLEGDAVHPAANRAKMAAGTPLDDADRAPWLAAIAAWMAVHDDGAVVACSALKRRYRTVLAAAATDVRFVHVRGDPALIAARLELRRGHFMPPTLLDSQFAALEPPASPDEMVIEIEAATDTQSQCEAVLGVLNL